MRAGELRHRAEILALDAEIKPRCLGQSWFGIIAKESADPAFPTGLRNPAKIDIRARYNPALLQGRYLRHEQRLFHITSVRDPLGNRAELRVTGEELIGEPAQLLPHGQAPRCVRVFLDYQSPWRDENGQVIDYRIRAEVALIEAGRVETDDKLKVGGVNYLVTAVPNDMDDGVVRNIWLEAI
ncbi:hypothetical protein M1D96_06515 [Pseudomonas sp. D1-3]